MKIFTFLLGVLFLISFTLSSCNNNSEEESSENRVESNTNYSTIKSDASKLVELQCRVMQLVGEAKNGNKTALMESEKFNQEAEKVSRELKEKYTTVAEQEKFAEAYQEALGDCK